MTDLNFIFSRRSIRRFTSEKINEYKIKLLLEAAMAAPTAMNMKPWHFVVVDDPSKLAELRATLPFGKMEAPLAISVCGNMQSIKRPVLERFGCRTAVQLQKTCSLRLMRWDWEQFGAGCIL